MSDRAHSRVKIPCRRCSRRTVHVVYQTSKVCTICGKPQPVTGRKK